MLPWQRYTWSHRVPPLLRSRAFDVQQYDCVPGALQLRHPVNATSCGDRLYLEDFNPVNDYRYTIRPASDLIQNGSRKWEQLSLDDANVLIVLHCNCSINHSKVIMLGLKSQQPF
jgi:hypothetical protein